MSIFANLSNSFADNIAIISDEGERISYAKLCGFSDYIKDLIPERALVFSLNRNTLGSICGYISFLRNNVVPLMLEAKIDFGLLERLVRIYSPEYLWLPTKEASKFPEGKLIGSVFDYSLIKLNQPAMVKLNDNLALLLATSGSTGSPKLVMLSGENIKSNTTSINRYLSIDQSDRPITTLPMSYSYGLSIINSHLYAGATILLSNRTLFEKEFWTFLKAKKATSLSGVPYTFEMLKKLRFMRMDVPSINTLTQAGGKLSHELNIEFSKFCFSTSKRFFVMYGQTEATARMSYLPHQQSLEKLGSIGIAIPGGDFSLIDDEGMVINSSHVSGELVYKGRNVSLGYAECANDLSKGDQNAGVLFTGDMAKRDDDGYYYIVGRKKRFIKIFGNRVNLDEAEQLLKNVVSDCACVGKDDQMNIYICDQHKIDEVHDYISAKISLHRSAFSVQCVDTIPKNSVGKTKYSKLPI